MSVTFVTCAMAAPIERASSLTAASQLLVAGARCVVVPRAFGRARLLPPPNFELRDVPLPTERDLPLDADVHHVLAELANAYRVATGEEFARGRVARVAGTPCPKAHVDNLRLRAVVTLRGPGVVLLDGADNDAVVLRSHTGDVVFMTGGLGYESHSVRPVWHRSPRRSKWMPDRLIVQVDDW